MFGFINKLAPHKIIQVMFYFIPFSGSLKVHVDPFARMVAY